MKFQKKIKKWLNILIPNIIFFSLVTLFFVYPLTIKYYIHPKPPVPALSHVICVSNGVVFTFDGVENLVINETGIDFITDTGIHFHYTPSISCVLKSSS